MTNWRTLFVEFTFGVLNQIRLLFTWMEAFLASLGMFKAGFKRYVISDLSVETELAFAELTRSVTCGIIIYALYNREIKNALDARKQPGVSTAFKGIKW